MCKDQMLRALVKQRLTAAAEEIFGLFQGMIAEYEEELSRSKEENERKQKQLDAVFNPQVQLHRTDAQQLLVVKEEQQEWISSLDQEDPEPPHIKEEQEELWTSQGGEQLQGLEDTDIKFPFSPVTVKTEENEEKPQSSQLHQRQTEQMRTEADGEDFGRPEPARNSDPHRHPEQDTDNKTGDSTEHKIDNSDDWKETREPQSGLSSLNNEEVPVGDSRCGTAVEHSVRPAGSYPSLGLQLQSPIRTPQTSRYFQWERQQEKNVLEQGISPPNVTFVSPESLPPAVERKGRTCMPNSSVGNLHILVLPPNTAGMAQLKQRLNKPVAPSAGLRPPFLAAVKPPPQTAPQHLCPSPRPLLPVPISLLCAAQPHQPVSQPLLPAFQSVVPAGSSLIDVPYSTQRYRKRRRREEEQGGKKRRKYLRKCGAITCKRCQKKRDPATHQQYFGNWYCQATATTTLAEWRAALETRGYGTKKAVAHL